MKTLIFDQYEFDPPHSEDYIEIAISARSDRRHPTMAKFADDVLGAGRGATLPAPMAFSTIPNFAAATYNLTHYGGITVPENCDWPCVVVLDEWNERHLLLDMGHAFVSYQWATYH